MRTACGLLEAVLEQNVGVGPGRNGRRVDAETGDVAGILSSAVDRGQAPDRIEIQPIERRQGILRLQRSADPRRRRRAGDRVRRLVIEAGVDVVNAATGAAQPRAQDY